jgi:hypothetical protein
MAPNNARGERGRRSRSLVLAAVLTVGTACGGGGDTPSPSARAGAAAEGATSERSGDARQQVIPSPLAEGGAGRKRPPAPDLGTDRPQAPPDTVSLESLHQQGRAHVMR